ncbi:MAG: glycosyltransferase [Flavobacteriales bacterium]|nr:glycosyltransferase [Flavobacteriales bacterium]
MKILYITYDGLTDPLGGSQVLPYVIGLAAAGNHFHIISFEKEDAYRRRKADVDKLMNEHGIGWTPLTYTKWPPVLSTLWDLHRMKQTAYEIHKRQLFDLVHCRSYIAALAGVEMKRRFGVPFLFDMRGFWADERVEGGIWNLKNPAIKRVYKYFKKKEKEFITTADAVVSLTENGRQEMLQWSLAGAAFPPIQVIPCCADMDLFNNHHDREASRAWRNRFGLPDDAFVLGYLGSVGTWYMLPEMLDFFRELLTTKPHARFLFITPDPPEMIKDMAQQRGVDASRIHVAFLPRQEVASAIHVFDLGIFFIRPCYSKKASSPTKMGELLASGIPIVCNAGVGDVDLVYRELFESPAITDLSKHGFAKWMKTIDTVCAFPGERLRETAVRHFSLETGVKKYREIYQAIANRR